MALRFLLILTLLLATAPGGAALGAQQKPLVQFGINLRHSPIPLYERYQPLMDYLTANTPYRFELKVARNYQEALRDLREGRTQFASLGDGAFVEAVLTHKAVPVVKPLNCNGKPFYRCVIVVQSGSPITRISELKGKKVAFGSRHSVSGNLVPWIMLGREGVSRSDFASASNLENHTAVAKAVLKGIVDAGAVKDVFAEKYSRYGMRTIAVSDPIPSAPLLAGAKTPAEMVKAVADALLKLNPNSPEDIRTMASWDREFRHGFVAAHNSDYHDVFAHFKQIPSGCATGCHR